MIKLESIIEFFKEYYGQVASIAYAIFLPLITKPPVVVHAQVTWISSGQLLEVWAHVILLLICIIFMVRKIRKKKTDEHDDIEGRDLI